MNVRGQGHLVTFKVTWAENYLSPYLKTTKQITIRLYDSIFDSIFDIETTWDEKRNDSQKVKRPSWLPCSKMLKTLKHLFLQNHCAIALKLGM